VLEPTKKQVLETSAMLDQAGINEQCSALCKASDEAFYNTSKFSLRDLESRGNQQQLRANVALDPSYVVKPKESS
jgi:type I restriction enzyme M protein